MVIGISHRMNQYSHHHRCQVVIFIFKTNASDAPAKKSCAGNNGDLTAIEVPNFSGAEGYVNPGMMNPQSLTELYMSWLPYDAQRKYGLHEDWTWKEDLDDAVCVDVSVLLAVGWFEPHKICAAVCVGPVRPRETQKTRKTVHALMEQVLSRAKTAWSYYTTHCLATPTICGNTCKRYHIGSLSSTLPGVV